MERSLLWTVLLLRRKERRLDSSNRFWLIAILLSVVERKWGMFYRWMVSFFFLLVLRVCSNGKEIGFSVKPLIRHRVTISIVCFFVLRSRNLSSLKVESISCSLTGLLGHGFTLIEVVDIRVSSCNRSSKLINFDNETTRIFGLAGRKSFIFTINFMMLQLKFAFLRSETFRNIFINGSIIEDRPVRLRVFLNLLCWNILHVWKLLLSHSEVLGF